VVYLNSFIDVLLIGYSLYYLTFIVLGLFDNQLFGQGEKEVSAEPESKFALIVPAHDEEAVISELLASLTDLDYPASLYDIFVVADNCQDDTAKLALEYDEVTVWERENEEAKGKDYALQFAFRRLDLLEGENDYDAVAIFDADNLVQENFLAVMNERLLQGERVIQAYLDSKNPADNWVTGTFSMMFWISDRFSLLNRYNLGLSAELMGTGMCISTDVLSEVGWNITTLTEDLEYTVQAWFEGIKTSFTRETKIFDEKPVSFWASCRQRLRWSRGQLSVIVKYVPRLLLQGLKERSIFKLDGAVRLFRMPFLMFYFLVTVIRLSFPGLFGSPLFDYVISRIKLLGFVLPLIPYIVPSLAFVLDKLPLEAYKYVLFFPAFMYSWIIVLYWALFTLDKQEWIHTDHSRNLSKEDLSSRSASTSAAKPEEAGGLNEGQARRERERSKVYLVADHGLGL